jgi:hypothetical protein
LFTTIAQETDNIPDHLDLLKMYRDRLNNFRNRTLHVHDNQFKAIISASLPDSWQAFVAPYRTSVDDDDDDSDAKKCITAENFIGIIHE